MSNLEGRVRIAEGVVWLISMAVGELNAKLIVAEAARSTILGALNSAEAQLEAFNQPGTSLREEVARLWSDNTCLDDQSKLAVLLSACTYDLPDSASEHSQTLCESVCCLSAHYDQELADLHYYWVAVAHE